MEREKLLKTTFTTNAEAAKQNGHTQNLNESMKSTSILIDHALIQNEALGRSNRAIDDILRQGSTMIGEKHHFRTFYPTNLLNGYNLPDIQKSIIAMYYKFQKTCGDKET